MMTKKDNKGKLESRLKYEVVRMRKFSSTVLLPQNLMLCIIIATSTGKMKKVKIICIS